MNTEVIECGTRSTPNCILYFSGRLPLWPVGFRLFCRAASLMPQHPLPAPSEIQLQHTCSVEIFF